MKKASISVGYSKCGLDEYKLFEKDELTGADVTAVDGIGNEIKVFVREGDEDGFKVEVNGVVVAEGGKFTRREA